MRKPLSFTCLGLGLLLAACGGSSTTPGSAAPITIGVSVSLSGDFSGDGKALVQGYDLWAQDINKSGGLLGHKVPMKYVDAASSTQQVVTNYQTLITQDKVALVFGPFSSLLTIPASPVTARFGSASPEPAGGGPKVFAQGLHSIFFVQPAAVEDNLVSYTKWLLSLPSGQKPKTAAYATQDDPFTQPQVDKAKALLEAGGVTTASYKVYPAETTDFTPLALQVVHANADVVILGTQEPDAVAFVKAFQQQHYNPKSLIETTGPDQGKDFADKVGAGNTEGIMVPAGWTPNATAYGNDKFVSEFVAKYGGGPRDITAHAPPAFNACPRGGPASKKGKNNDNKRVVTPLHSGPPKTPPGPNAVRNVGEAPR